MKESELQGYKYVTLMNLIAIFAVVVTLVIVSIASLQQTISAFKSMSDEDIVFLGIKVGLWLPAVYGVLFQYGQNAALYVHKHYCNDDVIYNIGEMEITSRKIAMGVFIICAFVDAATNVLWFNRSVQPTGDKIIDIIVACIGYPSMVLIVFAEEVLGIVLQALRRVWNQYKSIGVREKAAKAIAQARNPSGFQSPSLENTRTPYSRPTSTLRSSYNKPEEPTYEDL